jgi:glycosyltransferase involved in cell wall biosynthesis
VKILHLFSNTKWTGPAEPVVNLCRTLQGRGFDVTLACGRPSRDAQSPVIERARENGLRTVESLWLEKHFSVFHNLRDIIALQRLLRADHYDLVHAHMDNDHFVGGIAARRTEQGPLVVRTSYDGDGLATTARNRLLLSRYSDGLITCSSRARDADASRFALPAERLWTVHGAVDVSRFDPARHLPDVRARLGLTHDHFVVGIVARIQKRRKFDLLLEAVARSSRQVANLRLVIVGRGTHMGQVVVAPAKKLHLEDCVLFPGYFQGDEYVAMLNTFDVKVLLVPGTDGTCRALLEAMALAKPAVVTARGALPEIVRHEFNGLVVTEDAASLSDAIVRIARDARLRRDLGLNARRRAVDEFSLDVQASGVATVYESLAERGPLRKRAQGLKKSC